MVFISQVIDNFAGRGHSYNEATAYSPKARELERQAILELARKRASLSGDIKVADWQAAGGYVAQGLAESGIPKSQILCVEPSVELVAGIDPEFRVIHAELEQTPIESNSLDMVFCLAGLHHSLNKLEIFQEIYRVLKPGGWFFVAEVEVGSLQDVWLNGFVDQYTTTGHDGSFVKTGQLSSIGSQAGFSNPKESREIVPWVFSDRNHMVEFCQKLFGLRTDKSLVSKAIEKGLAPSDIPGGTIIPWQLLYASLQKAK